MKTRIIIFITAFLFALNFLIPTTVLSRGPQPAIKWKGEGEVIEFESIPKDLDAFTSELDKNLKLLNSDYATKRTNNLILKIHFQINGKFFKLLKLQGNI